MGLLQRLGLGPKAEVPWGDRWVLLPLGNPGEAYARTRHNLGRLVLQRWVAARALPAPCLRAFPSGVLHEAGPFLVLMPGTYMNLSGRVCAEALGMGLDPARLLVLGDDKDLPLGRGRLRLEGSDGGHNGLASVMEAMGSRAVPRLRLGIGPFVRPLDQFVLGTWDEAEWARIEAMDRPFSRVMEALAACATLAGLPGLVNPASFWDAGLPVEEGGES